MTVKPLGLDASYRGFGVSCGKETIDIATEPNDTQTQSQNCQRRCQEIIAKIVGFINKNYDNDDCIMFVLEGMSYGSQSGHLADMGWMFSEIYNRLPMMIGERKSTIIEVPPSSLKKWIAGNGRADKDMMKAAIKERWGVEFERDKAGNKTDAFCLYKYGIACLEEEIKYEAPKRRGKGDKQVKKAQAKKNAHAKRSTETSPAKETASKAPVVRRSGGTRSVKR